MRRNKKNTKKSLLIALVALVIILAGAYTYVAAREGYWPFPSAPRQEESEQTSTDDDTTTPNQPNDTNEDSSTYNGIKNSNGSAEPQEPTPTTGTKKTVGVGIASAGPVETNVEVRAFVTDVIEGSGTCTATFKKGAITVTASSQAFIDVSTSQCEPIRIDASRFEKGTWNLVVSYTSPTSNGASETLEVSL